MTEKIKNLDIKNLTIWVGAGISIKEPSRLPSGNELTEFAFETMIIGKEKLFEIWAQINSFEKEFCNFNVTKFPRLELLLSSIAYIEKFFMGKKSLEGHFLNGLQSFDEVPFNDNHILLAAMAHAGARIMTANFDLGIERAYKKMYAEECKSVIHFHGTNMSGDKIGATIENITHFVNKSVEHKVRSNFHTERTNYFYGYSFSDTYDINTTIYELYSNYDADYTKDNWICNHNGWDRELENKVCSTFIRHENFHIFEAETTESLKALCQKYSVNLPNQIENSLSDFTNNKHWKELFLEKIKITEEFRILSTIHFVNRMGIAIDKISIEVIKRYLELEFDNDKKEILEYHLAANSKYWFQQYGNSRLKTDYHKKALNQRQSTSKLEKLFPINVVSYNVKDTVKNIKQKNFIMYEDFNELNIRMHDIKFQLLKNTELEDVTDTKYLVDFFSKYPVGKFIEIILYAATHRYKMLLDGVLEKSNLEEYKRANAIYYDIGNIDGIVSTQLDYVVSHNYKKDSDGWKIIFQSTMWIQLKYLCKITGSYRYEQLMNLFEIEKGGMASEEKST